MAEQTALKFPFMGIPTPNLFAGGENMHGRFEYVSLETMERAVDTIIGIVPIKIKTKPQKFMRNFCGFFTLAILPSNSYLWVAILSEQQRERPNRCQMENTGM